MYFHIIQAQNYIFINLCLFYVTNYIMFLPYKPVTYIEGKSVFIKGYSATILLVRFRSYLRPSLCRLLPAYIPHGSAYIWSYWLWSSVYHRGRTHNMVERQAHMVETALASVGRRPMVDVRCVRFLI